jgi:hypothetical protein
MCSRRVGIEFQSAFELPLSITEVPSMYEIVVSLYVVSFRKAVVEFNGFH